MVPLPHEGPLVAVVQQLFDLCRGDAPRHRRQAPVRHAEHARREIDGGLPRDPEEPEERTEGGQHHLHTPETERVRLARDEARDVRQTERVQLDGAGGGTPPGQKPTNLGQIVHHRRTRQAPLLGEVPTEPLLHTGQLRGIDGRAGSGDDADLAQMLKERAQRRPVAALASPPPGPNELRAPPFVDALDVEPPASEPPAEVRDELQLLPLRGFRVAAGVEQRPEPCDVRRQRSLTLARRHPFVCRTLVHHVSSSLAHRAVRTETS